LIVDFRLLKNIIRIGVPIGIQAIMYTVSNMIIQTYINGFGTNTIAAWTAYGRVDFLFWMIVNAMGISVTMVLIFSNFFISVLRKFIPNQVRIASYIVVISGFVTALELLIKAYLPDVDASLGVFIPLIVVNCIILARAEAFASKNKPMLSSLDGLAMGLGFTFALIVVSAIREILGSGSILGISLFGAGFKPALVFIMPPGAFLTLAFVIAASNKIRKNSAKKKAEKEKHKTDVAESEAAK